MERNHAPFRTCESTSRKLTALQKHASRGRLRRLSLVWRRAAGCASDEICHDASWHTFLGIGLATSTFSSGHGSSTLRVVIVPIFDDGQLVRVSPRRVTI